VLGKILIEWYSNQQAYQVEQLYSRDKKHHEFEKIFDRSQRLQLLDQQDFQQKRLLARDFIFDLLLEKHQSCCLSRVEDVPACY
jgi:hypothetical protein